MDQLIVTNGTFELLRRGHKECLKAAKALAPNGRLVVLLNSDASVRLNKGEGRPVKDLAYRTRKLLELPYVDAVIPFDDKSPRELIRNLRPSHYVKGGDYTIDSIDPRTRQICNEVGCEIVFIPRTHNLSTTRIIQRLQKWGYYL